GYAGLVAGRIGRIQRELGQEAFPRRISGSDLLELEQVGPPGLGIFMDAIEMWFIPKACTLQIDGPFRISEIAQGLDEALPIVARARRRRYARERRDRVGGLSHKIKHTLRGGRADAGQKMQQTESGDAVAPI